MLARVLTALGAVATAAALLLCAPAIAGEWVESIGLPQGVKTAPSPGPKGPELVPIPTGPPLAPAASPGLGKGIDGIKCERNEQVLFHIHAHLTIFVAGKARRIPYGIGIGPPRSVQPTANGPFVVGGSCFSWLHTHAADGIIHIESPVRRGFTLGDFFDLWGQPLSSSQVGPARGRVTAFVNGRSATGNPRRIPLRSHSQIQLDLGNPVIAPESITFSGGL
jgi:hypothetical protein